MQFRRLAATAFAAGMACPSICAFAQDSLTAIPPSHTIQWQLQIAQLALSGSPENAKVIFSHLVKVPYAAWLRISFAGTILGGDPASEGAQLRITSLRDGGVQLLSGESLAAANFTSVFFNGDSCLVELIARGGIEPSTLAINEVTAGEYPGGWSNRSICGSTDDRQLSADPRLARMLSIGCTAWLINDTNHQFLTAGHCTPGMNSIMECNVPLSLEGGALVHPMPEDQYPVDAASSQLNSGGVGNDWQYLGALVNSTTGRTAWQSQQHSFTAADAPAAQGDIRITGYGVVSSPVSLTWNQVQKTNLGPYSSLTGSILYYVTDTTSGNSGSPIILESTGAAIGIHTHAGCTSTGGTNRGTAFQFPALQAALASPRSVCATGKGTPSGRLFIIGDAANNFGTLSTDTGHFARISSPGVFYQGLAYNPIDDTFYAINSLQILERIDPATGAAVEIGKISGTNLTLNSLAFDPIGNRLYSITSSTGQLWSINPVTRRAVPIGSPMTRKVAGADFDPIARVLWAVEETASGCRLLKINLATGASTIIGSLGTGINECKGLAVDPVSTSLFAVDARTDSLYRIDSASGHATLIGPTDGVFGSAFGMAYRYDWRPCQADFNEDGVIDFADYLDFLAAFAVGSSSSDLNSDEVSDLFDYLDFIATFSSGC